MWISVDWEVTIDRAEHLVFSTADKMSKATLVGDDSQKNILYCMKCLFVFLKRVLDQALLKKNSSYEEKEQKWLEMALILAGISLIYAFKFNTNFQMNLPETMLSSPV